MHAGEEDHARPGLTTSIRGHWTGLPVKESIRMTGQRTELNGENTSVVWPTLGSRTAEEENRTRAPIYRGRVGAAGVQIDSRGKEFPQEEELAYYVRVACRDSREYNVVALYSVRVRSETEKMRSLNDRLLQCREIFIP